MSDPFMDLKFTPYQCFRAAIVNLKVEIEAVGDPSWTWFMVYQV